MAIKDIPIDVVPDEEFNARWGTKADGSWRGYAAGTPAEQRRSNEAKALSAAWRWRKKRDITPLRKPWRRSSLRLMKNIAGRP